MRDMVAHFQYSALPSKNPTIPAWRDDSNKLTMACSRPWLDTVATSSCTSGIEEETDFPSMSAGQMGEITKTEQEVATSGILNLSGIKENTDFQPKSEKQMKENSNFDQDSHMIDPTGGEIIGDEFQITFSEGTFLSPTNIKVSMQIRPSEFDPNYIGISPILSIDVDQPLLKPATIKLNTWSVPDGSKEVTAYIRQQANENEPWQKIEEITLSRKRFVEFKCQQFSLLEIVVRKLFFKYLRHSIMGCLYGDDSNGFQVGLCFDSTTYLKNLKNDLQENGSTFKFRLNTIILKAEDKIIVKINTIENLQLVINPVAGHLFTFDDGFKDPIYRFLLSGGKGGGEQCIAMNLSILINGKEDGNNQHPFHHKLKNREDDSSKGEVRKDDRESMSQSLHFHDNARVSIVGTERNTQYVGTQLTGNAQGTMARTNCTSNIGSGNASAENLMERRNKPESICRCQLL